MAEGGPGQRRLLVVVILFVVALGVCLAFLCSYPVLLPRRPSFPRREALLLLLAAALTVMPWTVRNGVRFGRFIPVNDQGQAMVAWNLEHMRTNNDPGQAGIWRSIRSHPREFLVERTLRNAVHFAAPPRDWWIERGLVPPGKPRPLFWTLVALFHLPLYVALLAASLRSLRKPADPRLTFLVLMYWGYWAEHALVWGDPRFGLAVYPVLPAIALSQAKVFIGRGANGNELEHLHEVAPRQQR